MAWFRVRSGLVEEPGDDRDRPTSAATPTLGAVLRGPEGQFAVREVNYASFAALVTALIVYSQRILGADAAESGMDRLVETILGVAIASAVLGITEARARARGPAA